MSNAALRILLLSNVLPANTSGGEIVLHRHLYSTGDFDVLALRPSSSVCFNSRVWRRLKCTRLHRWCNDAEELLQHNSPSKSIATAAERFQPDLILTVAHGRGYVQALHVAKCFNIPLVTIYHDWWPDLAPLHSGIRRIAQNRFMKIAQQSQLCLCVSEGMAKQLGTGARTRILYPIPGSPLDSRGLRKVRDKSVFRLGYFGSMHEYAAMLQQFAMASLSQDSLQFELRGSPDWAQKQRVELERCGVLLPYVPRKEFEQWIQGLDAILCVMSFANQMRRRMETSFPSKLIESLQLGKPIILWGPEYSSAVQWARRTNACLAVTDENPELALRAVKRLATDHLERSRLIEISETLVAGNYSAENIQHEFTTALLDVLQTHRRCREIAQFSCKE